MIKIVENPPKDDWEGLLKRPTSNFQDLMDKVAPILEDIQVNGDEAVRSYSLRFDGADIEQTLVSLYEWEEAINLVPEELKQAIRLAINNIEVFHKSQCKPEPNIETMNGIFCHRKSIGIEKVGLYIPGGTAPLFSTVIMLGIPAKLAGCKEVILCTPPNKEGKIHPAILFAAHCVGISKVFKIGGIQAIGAMAFGTKRVPKVSKIFGPGNQFVTAAKQWAQLHGTAIDMPAGPSELCVLADKTANPEFVAADLLSQAEHGMDSQVVLITDHLPIAYAVLEQLGKQLPLLPRAEIAEVALSKSLIIVVNDLEVGMDISNEYAPEHLIIACSNEDYWADRVVNAGSVFLGNYSPESAGDYASGTNHTLPTQGFARAYSGVSVDSFVRKTTFQKISPLGLKGIGQSVIDMSEAEGLMAHSRAISVRLKDLESK